MVTMDSSFENTPHSSPLRRRIALVLPALLLVAAGVGCGTDEDARPADARAQPGVGEEADGPGAPARGMSWVIFEADTVRAEVADTPDARERGLMFRESLEPGAGMLFVFDESRVRSFWMRDTFIPLSIAFIDSDLRVVDIQQMEPESEEFYESGQPAMFALEVPQNWFQERGIEVGQQARIIFGPR